MHSTEEPDYYILASIERVLRGGWDFLQTSLPLALLQIAVAAAFSSSRSTA
jgi:hypothetical protein